MPDFVRNLRHSELEHNTNNLVWTVHLARCEPVKFILSVLACFVAGLVGLVILKNPFPVIIMLAALLASISDFLLPVTYKVGPRGASSTSLLFRRVVYWEHVKACYLDESGIKLSTIGQPSRREAVHGVYLRFANNRDEVVKTVRTLRKSTDD